MQVDKLTEKPMWWLRLESRQIWIDWMCVWEREREQKRVRVQEKENDSNQ